MKESPVLLWFRQDLRLSDNPALHAAAKLGTRVLPVYIWAPEEEAPWPPGAGSSWWRHHALASLASDLPAIGSRLVIRPGPSIIALRALVAETGARAVFWNRLYEPSSRDRDQRVAESLRDAGVLVDTFNSHLLHEPWTISNQSGRPFQVFSAFWRRCLALQSEAHVPSPLPSPGKLRPLARWPKGLPLAELKLEPAASRAAAFGAAWEVSEPAALQQLDHFLAHGLETYSSMRNRPDVDGTSRLSPYLHFGQISARTIWERMKRKAEQTGDGESWRQSQFVAELYWREFAHHLLWHFPQTPLRPLRQLFESFPWRPNTEWLEAWQLGRTGYPFVDAGLRQLRSIGWMHNRVRMVAASFLVKHLLLPWQEGARWFWDTLVDADLANNSMGWQWTAGCGADAAPYFRIFNPVTQGEKFDPEGAYVRRWIPELAQLPARWIHQPFAAPVKVLESAGIRLGITYPKPIVPHSIARNVALDAYARMRLRAGKPPSRRSPEE